MLRVFVFDSAQLYFCLAVLSLFSFGFLYHQHYDCLDDILHVVFDFAATHMISAPGVFVLLFVLALSVAMADLAAVQKALKDLEVKYSAAQVSL